MGYPPYRHYGRLIAHTAALWSGATVGYGIYDQGRCGVELEALARVFGCGLPPHRRYGRLITHTAVLWSEASV